MTPERWQQIRTIVEQALELTTKRRRDFLHEACGADQSLLQAAETLISLDSQAQGFLDDDEGIDVRTALGAAEEDVEPPTRIGSYHIVSKLAEGGMGEVYVAEQRTPVRRTVAIKLIRPGMNTQEIVSRFEAERQALAMMDHPCIASVFEVGATESGRPFFVMEYVKGEPITEHCDRHRLDTHARLELFIQVCEGVQHAHQKGVIHRDLKPSNVLVKVEGIVRTPKIIDFGVAKAIQQPLTERTLFTQMGQLVGTPAYMSPEQAGATATDIDTRTDVYALGVLLYELLVGALPVDFHEIPQGGLEEMLRRIREEEPSKPSTRISSPNLDSGAVARGRRTTRQSLARRLRGDLDWITMRALEKDRTRRYGSPAEFAADVRRHLADEPVLAGPPSLGYRLTKLIHRHRVGAVAVALVLAAIVTGAIAAGIGFARASAEAERAQLAEGDARRTADFLVGLFELANPFVNRGKEPSMRDLVEIGAERIEEGALADSPLVRARIMAVLGHVNKALGNYDAARSLLERAVELYDGSGPDAVPDDRWTATRWLADLYLALDEKDRAERLYRQVIAECAGVPCQEETALTAKHNLAVLLRKSSRYEESLELLEEVVARRRETLDPDDGVLLQTLASLAAVYQPLARFDEARAIANDVRERRMATLGPRHPDTLLSVTQVADSHAVSGDIDKAVELYLEVIPLYEEVFGPRHRQTLNVKFNLTNHLAAGGRVQEAEALCTEVLEVQREELGETHGKTLITTAGLANLYEEQGKLDEAERLYRRSIEGMRASDHPDLGKALFNLGVVLAEWNRLPEAEEVLRDALGVQRNTLAPDHPDIGDTLRNLAISIVMQGRVADAEPLFREAFETRRRGLPSGDPRLAESAADLVRVYRMLEDPDAIEKLVREVTDDPWLLKELQQLAAVP